MELNWSINLCFLWHQKTKLVSICHLLLGTFPLQRVKRRWDVNHIINNGLHTFFSCKYASTLYTYESNALDLYLEFLYENYRNLTKIINLSFHSRAFEVLRKKILDAICNNKFQNIMTDFYSFLWSIHFHIYVRLSNVCILKQIWWY